MIFNHLIDSRKIFRIGYLFRYTGWGQQLLTALNTHEMTSVTIQWNFWAHHFRQNIQTWKRSHAAGGGVIRFYGIHIIALLAEMGYDQVDFSETAVISGDEYEKWRVVFTGRDLPQCEVMIDSRSLENRFRVIACSNKNKQLITTVMADIRDPFDLSDRSSLASSLDKRIPMLSRLCQSLWESNAGEYDWYATTIKLWYKIEEKNKLQERKETLREKKIS
jgi:hypothetical protein